MKLLAWLLLRILKPETLFPAVTSSVYAADTEPDTAASVVAVVVTLEAKEELSLETVEERLVTVVANDDE